MTQTTNAFAAWMLATYEHNELADICNHGCASCAPAGMVYYTENVALFEQYRDALFEIMADYQETVDAPDSLPEYVCKNSATYELFCNSVVWFCAESVALYATDGSYIDETEEAATLAQQDTHATHVVLTKDLTVDEKVALADRLNLNGRIVVIDAIIAAFKEKNK